MRTEQRDTLDNSRRDRSSMWTSDTTTAGYSCPRLLGASALSLCDRPRTAPCELGAHEARRRRG
jgi:hypothetical protein